MSVIIARYIRSLRIEPEAPNSSLVADAPSAAKNASAYLAAAGIKRVAVGHQPSGDTPLVMTETSSGVSFHMCDTSYCATAIAKGTTAAAHPSSVPPTATVRNASASAKLDTNFREHAAVEVLFSSDDGSGGRGGDDCTPADTMHPREEQWTTYHGTFVDGQRYVADASHPFVGRRLKGWWWVVGRFWANQSPIDAPEDTSCVTPPKYLLRRSKDAFYSIEQRWASEAEVAALVAEADAAEANATVSKV
jgi:hypothetical protein